MTFDTTTRPLRPAIRISAIRILMIVAAAAAIAIWSEAYAQSVRIVALGASNTAGWGVGSSAAWPARLEAMLRARNVNAEVINAGVSGNSSRDLLARLDSAVPTGARIVILHVDGYNDLRKGQVGEFNANVAQIKARLATRKITVLHLSKDVVRALIRSHAQADRIHLTSEGHMRLAAHILPQVLAAIRK